MLVMDDLLLPIQTVKKIQSNIDKFESLSLNDTRRTKASSTKSKRSILDITSTSSDATDESLDLKPSTASSQTSVSSNPPKKHKRYDSSAFLQRSYLSKSPPTTLTDDALQVLKSQPEPEDLLAVLQYLQYGIDEKHDFNLHVAGAQASQIISTLVTKTIPDYWPLYDEDELSSPDPRIREFVLHLLRSVPGIGAILLQLRQLSSVGIEQSPILQHVASALASVIRSSTTLQSLLQDTTSLYPKQSMRRAVWQEVVALLAGSKILSTSTQALSSMGPEEHKNLVFLLDGNHYVQWLARNVVAVLTRLPLAESDSWIMLSQVVKRGLNLGYRDAFVSELYSSLLLGSRALWTPLKQLLEALTASEQRTFFDAMLRDLTRKYLRTGATVESLALNGLESDEAIGGVAAIVSGLVEGNRVMEEHLTTWLTSSSGEYATLGLDTRRAVIATLALRKEKLHQILEKCLETFGDKIQIQHSPILQQETTAATLLLALGYLYRLDLSSVKNLSKQGVLLQPTSNRLAASVSRARLLGMIVAMAVSKLVDTPDMVMKFDLDELDGEGAQKWFGLSGINDKIGKLDDLKNQRDKPVIELVADVPQKSRAMPRKRSRPQQETTSKIIAIEEIDEDEDEQEDDLVPYQKPEDDPSDSEDDPTLIDRSKPSAPVYIIDLINQLQLNDKPDTVSLALRTAPSLIRRKANFGTELSENVTVVASALINLKSDTHKPEIHSLRLSALLACLVSKPKLIGPWAASLYFTGDMSLAQRASLLSMLGLGARELSGHKDETSSLPPSESFPSQHLPPHLSALYSPTETIARQLEHTTIRPLALAAADKVTGPDILKIRTFSSRMEVEKKRTAKAAERTKRIPKDLHSILSSALYLPLCCRMSLILSSSTTIQTTPNNSTIFSPHLLRLFLQTLTIILVSLGPNATQLNDITRETLLLLTNLHNTPRLCLDPVVLPAFLHLLLSTLDINMEAGVTAQERLVTEFGTVMVELVGWAGKLDDQRIPVLGDEEGEGSGGTGGMPWNVLVAGIQVKWQEMGRKYQGRMMGLMGGGGGDMDDW